MKLIYLDLDDVLNVLAPYLLHELGCEIGVREYEKYPADKFGYDIVGACNFMLKQDTSLPEVCYTVEEFWGEVDHHMWANAPKSKEFCLTINLAVDAVGSENVRILTRATANAGCLSGKFEWMDKNLPFGLKRKYIIVGEDCKHLLADKDSFLLDDSNANVDSFRASGGVAALMPRPWNRAGHIKSTIEHIKNIFGILQ